MAEETQQETTAAQGDIEGGNYEVIRARLVEQGKALAKRTEALNQKRKDVFGGTELSVVANERIRTENNCVPRDIIQVGGLLLLGYQVFIGVKSETRMEDVFALHKFEASDEGFDCSAVGLDALSGLLSDPEFQKGFDNLYKYSRDARLLSLQRDETKLLAVFQVGGSIEDVKVFRWRFEGDGSIRYVDDRGERDYVFPPSHAFEWKAPGVEAMVEGRHINVADKVFISNLGGKLTLRVEDNTETGRVCYSNQLDDSNQVLIDLRVEYALVGELVLLKVLPFREESHRYLVFNSKTERAVQIDAIGLACQELPEDHGIIFPGGYYLATGDYKIFEAEKESGLEFVRKIASPNGEDVLYIFHRRRDGHYVLFPYNLIRKEVQTPIHCHGYSLFDDGKLVVFKAMSDEPTRVHPMQVWDTPFTSAAFAAEAPTDGSFLAKVGNAELVRGISDAFSLCRLIANAEPTRLIFEDLIKNTARTIDAYYWLNHKEVGDLQSVLKEIAATSELIIDEFEKVVAFREQAKAALAETEERFVAVTRDLRTEHYKRVDPFLEALTSLRSLRGHIITLREMRYVDLERLQELEDQTIERFDLVSKDCVSFLLKEEALAPLKEDLEGTIGLLADVGKVADVMPLKEKVDKTAEGLDLLSEVIANLKIDDATKRTQILEGISEVFAQLNRTRATIEGRRKELLQQEGRAEFAAQFALIGQSVSSALSVCDTPEKCDEQLSRLLVQIEELEGRFSELDEYLADLAQKRDEIYEAFSAKKQQLLDERQRRIQNIESAAGRILEGVGRRARAMKDADELNAYFASDAMVMKVRDLCEQLGDLGDHVKADSLLAQLSTARQNALRGLRDKLELFEGGADVIKLGRHRFSVNTQRLELTMVPREGLMQLHLSGTDFYQVIDDPEFAATERFWSQDLVSENAQVYRCEYLAHEILQAAEAGRGGLTVAKLHEHMRESTLLEVTRPFAQDRYDEGYERGLHDADTALILDKLINLRESAGLLRYPPAPRALGALFWDWLDDDAAKKRWHLQAKSLGRLRKSLGHTDAMLALAKQLSAAMASFVAAHDLGEWFADEVVTMAGPYLVEELVADDPHFATSQEAVTLHEALLRYIDLHGDRRAFDDDMRALADQLRERFSLCRAWVDAFLAKEEHAARRFLAIEVAVMLCDKKLSRSPSAALTEVTVQGLLGNHKRIDGGAMTLRIDELLARVGRFSAHEVPAYRAYRDLRTRILEEQRVALRLDEYMPKVMTAFVRNKLINDVYLPLIGDNLAKQIGAAGEGKRTDLMGLLLLISPPGYGKTTLMEYIANRLGLVFMKVNGPSLGHSVMSLDPSEAPNATARQEVEKINLAFEMGNNVMLYLDDIQHTHPELLQKFISLCDAQRRIEGVWKGRTRTYDMRGRKFCVVMAGNPYTESGDKFQIPDMLANRADTYNLGDILEGKGDAFALSYIENALTSNPALQPLATREQSDVYQIIRMAQGEEIPTSELKHGYSAVELTEIKAVMGHMFRVRDVLLMVNQQYIASASQDDRFRTEPRFQLQGSYRNMNRMAEKIVSAMNPAEAEALITDHYVGESQTLTTGAEANLLKLGEMRGTLSDEQKLRWRDIKEEFVRHARAGGSADDPVSRLTGTLSGLSEDLTGIKHVLAEGSNKGVGEELKRISTGLALLRRTLEEGTSGGLDEKLDGVSQQIAAIREGLDLAAARLAEKLATPAPQVPRPGDGLDDNIDTMGQQLALQMVGIRDAVVGASDKVAAQLAAQSQAQAEATRQLAERLAAQGPVAQLPPQPAPAQLAPAHHAAQPPHAQQPPQAQPPLAQALVPANPQDADPHGARAPSPTHYGFADMDANPRVGRAERLAGSEQWMKPYLLRIEAALEALSHPKVQVQISTPQEMQIMMQQQVQLVEHTILPLVREAAGRLRDSEQVMHTLHEVRTLLRGIQQGR